MSEIMVSSTRPLPEPKTPINIRPAVLSDVPFMDSLQKLHSKQVGWMPTKQFEGKIAAGHVLIAEELVGSRQSSVGRAEEDSLQTADSRLPTYSPVGYLIACDRYFKRDDVGIIYQMNVSPQYQRRFVAAALLRAQFERSAYGCRLYCCWCAQDIAANHFWEAMGFVPLAFRTGGRGKKAKRNDEVGTMNDEVKTGISDCTSSFIDHRSSFSSRVHIFWQKRIRQGDTSTPWWFPSQTSSGAIREDRIVLPIPPGTHWSDAKPMILPGEASVGQAIACRDHQQRQGKVRRTDSGSPRGKTQSAVTLSGLRFAPVEAVGAPRDKPKREKKPKQKNSPQLVAAARELRDRWLEQVNAGQYLPESTGKYAVHRAIAEAGGNPPLLLIEAA